MESSTHGSQPPFKKTKVGKVPRKFFYIGLSSVHYFELEIIATETTVLLESIPKEMIDLIMKDVKLLATLKDTANVPKLGKFRLIGNGIFVYFHKAYHTFSAVDLSDIDTFLNFQEVGVADSTCTCNNHIYLEPAFSSNLCLRSKKLYEGTDWGVYLRRVEQNEIAKEETKQFTYYLYPLEGFIPNERTLRKRLFYSMSYLYLEIRDTSTEYNTSYTSFLSDFCCTDLRWEPSGSTSPFPFIGVPDIVFKRTKPIYIGNELQIISVFTMDHRGGIALPSKLAELIAQLHTLSAIEVLKSKSEPRYPIQKEGLFLSRGASILKICLSMYAGNSRPLIEITYYDGSSEGLCRALHSMGIKERNH